jgi:hypothetical protein
VRRTGILEAVQEDPADPATVRNRGNTSGVGDVTVLNLAGSERHTIHR